MTVPEDGMKKPRRLSEAKLPDAPLDFARPFSVSGAQLQDAVIAAEMPEAYALPAVRTYRLVLDWARGQDQASILHEAAALDNWEEEILEYSREIMEIWAPLVVIAGEVRASADADPEQIARACIALTEWGLGNGATGTALLFAEAAALAAPSNARHAYVAGRLLRHHGALAEAETWLRRAARVAIWNRDREVHALCLNSIGNLHQQAGRYPEARAALAAALRVARRAGLQERQAAALHDLMVVSVYTGELAAAEEFARGAFAAYPPDHANVPKLAADIAFLWAQQGQFARALEVFRALLPHFADPDARLRITGYTARAAGAIGDADTFRAAWAETWSILDARAAEHLRAAAALELGLGALNLGAWEDAGMALNIARETAELSRDYETIARAEVALEQMAREERADLVIWPGARNHPSDTLARDLVRTLMSAGPADTPEHDSGFDA
jgi:tetratricopeptide (TPR) repeat protein